MAPCAARKLAVAISNRLKTKLKGIFHRFFVENQKEKKRSSSQTEGILFRIFFEGFSGIFVHIYDQNRYFFVQGHAAPSLMYRGPRLGTTGLQLLNRSR